MDRSYPDGRRVHLSLVANPSHLEAVDPVVIGKVRAKQYLSGNREEDKLKHMPVLLHGQLPCIILTMMVLISFLRTL